MMVLVLNFKVLGGFDLVGLLASVAGRVLCVGGIEVFGGRASNTSSEAEWRIILPAVTNSLVVFIDSLCTSCA